VCHGRCGEKLAASRGGFNAAAADAFDSGLVEAGHPRQPRSWDVGKNRPDAIEGVAVWVEVGRDDGFFVADQSVGLRRRPRTPSNQRKQLWDLDEARAFIFGR
jgi:hypothetical protein